MLWESSSTYLKFKKEAGLRMGEWDQQEGNQRGAYQLNEYFLLCQLRAKPIMRGQVAQDAYLRIKCVCVCVTRTSTALAVASTTASATGPHPAPGE